MASNKKQYIHLTREKINNIAKALKGKLYPLKKWWTHPNKLGCMLTGKLTEVTENIHKHYKTNTTNYLWQLNYLHV